MDSPPASQANPVEVDGPASPAKEQNIFPETDWNSLGDFDSLIASFAMDSQGQHEPVPQPYDYAPPSDGWAGGDNAVFDQSTDQSYPQDQNFQDPVLHPALEMQPTWDDFMTRMFGNGFGS
jgi:hypothetical protein